MNYPGLEKDFLDPRTKIAVLAVLPILTTCSKGALSTAFTVTLGVMPMILLSFVRRCTAAGILSTLCYACIVFLCQYESGDFSGTFKIFMLLLSMFGFGLFPCVMSAVYLKKSTSDYSFISALYKMHCPIDLIIPIAVVFRYFPVLSNEYRRISLALRQRGIEQKTKRMIPLIVNAVQISSELASAAMLRGIDTGIHTPVDENRMCLQDWLILLLCTAGVLTTLMENF